MQGVLDAVRKVSAVVDLDEFRIAVLAAVRGLVSCDGAGYNEVDPRVPRVVYLTDPVDYADPEVAARLPAYAHEHPVMEHIRKTGDGSARKISDFVTQQEFHRLGLYRDLYAHLGIEYQIVITLPSPQPLIVALVATRAQVDFSERDRRVLDALRPHLIQAYRRAEMNERLRGDTIAVATALAGRDRGVAIVEPDGNLRLITPQAKRWVREFFDLPADSEQSTNTPTAILDWLSRQTTRLRTGPDVPAPAAPLVVERDDRRLVVRHVHTAGRDMLLLDVRPQREDPSALCTLGLTRRESEILLLASNGLSNQAIAQELGLREATVKKHLEHIYRKLGVRNRTEAASAAFEALSLEPTAASHQAGPKTP